MPRSHAALTNVLAGQHHRAQETQQISNTSLSVSPLPGGPGVWDISVDEDVVAVMLALRSNNTTWVNGFKAGVALLVGRSMLDAAAFGAGGAGSITITSFAHTYAKKAGAVYLSDRIFSDTGDMIALTDAYLTLTAPSTRVLRTTWTNHDASYRTLNVWGEMTLLS